ncbi:MAG: TolC family protein [Bacteroidales bacterium]|nr:TolC family protein [Bacteroidales bacterium]
MASTANIQVLDQVQERFENNQLKLFSGIFLFLFFLIFILKANAQDTKEWSLEECINYALDNNISVKQQDLNIDYQQELLLQSKLGILPNVNGFANYGYNFGKSLDPYTNRFYDEDVTSNTLSVQGDLNIFSGLQQLKRIKRNMLNLQAAQFDADYYRDEISITVAMEYLQTLYYLEFVEMAYNQLDITNQQVTRTSKLVEAGTLAKGDLLIIEAQQASEELSVVEAENNLTLSYLNLTQLLELDTPEGFVIEKPELGLIDQPEIFTPEQIYGIAVENRPEIKSAEIKVESSERELGIARGTFYPSLSLNASIGSGYSGKYEKGVGEKLPLHYPQIGKTASDEDVYALYQVEGYAEYDVPSYGVQLSDNIYQSIFLNLRIPIFNGWTSRSSVAQAKIGIANADLELQQQKRDLYKIIQQAYNDALAALNKHKAADKRVNATGESFNYAEQKFNVGLINSVEYNDAKKEANNALSQLIQAKYDFVFRTTVIDFYMGKPLTLKR